MYLSSQPFFKTPHKLQNSKENPTKMHFPVVCRTEFHFFSFGVYHGPTTKQTVKKLNLWRETAVDKSAWIKACYRERGGGKNVFLFQFCPLS